MSEKVFIKNRKGMKIVVLVEAEPNQKGLVFVMHGFSWFKEQPEVRSFAEVFRENGFTVVTFDTTNSFGESDGRIEDSILTNYCEDLDDVIVWASSQKWYREPFWLAGHSLGGAAIVSYAIKNPDKVKALAPISTFVSGELSLEAEKKLNPVKIKDWQESGWLIEKSSSRPGVVRKLPWSHMEDRLKYNLLLDANKLKMPVLVVVGEKDESTPLEQQQRFFDKLNGSKEMRVIKGAGHELRKPEYVAEMKAILDKWIKSNL